MVSNSSSTTGPTRLVLTIPWPGVARTVLTAKSPRAPAANAAATISFHGNRRLTLRATDPTDLNGDITSLLRSALGWRGIGPGAQTKRRGGAGPAGGLLWR